VKLDFGSKVKRPMLAVTMSSAEEAKISADGSAMEALERLKAEKEVGYERQDDRSRLHFRLRSMGHRRQAVHELHFGRIIDVLGGLAGYNHAPEDDQELRALSFSSTVASGEKRLGLAAEFVLPAVEDERLSNLTTWVMQGAASQINYERRIGLSKKGYEGFIFASVNRNSDGEESVLLQTNPFHRAHMSLEHIDFSSPERPVVNLAAYNLSSHKQQLVCLAGVAAITQAAEYLAHR
jgi:hypothetical protein